MKLLLKNKMIEQYDNEYEFRVIGMQRCGNHPIIEWLLSHFEGKKCFLNFVKVDTNPFTTYHKTQGSHVECIDIDAEVQGKFSKKEVLMYSYEDDLIEEIVTDYFEQNREKWLGKSRYKIDILLLRNPYNLFASRLQREFTIGNKIPLKTIYHAIITREVWKDHAESFVFGNKLLNLLVTINFDEWLIDKKYREKIANVFNKKVNDSTLSILQETGGTHKFYKTSEVNEEFRKKELVRWKEYLNDPYYIMLISDYELYSIASKIYNKKYLPYNGKKILLLERLHKMGAYYVYSQYLQLKRLLFSFAYKLYLNADSDVGKIGLFIRKKSPFLYSTLKGGKSKCVQTKILKIIEHTGLIH